MELQNEVDQARERAELVQRIVGDLMLESCPYTREQLAQAAEVAIDAAGAAVGAMVDTIQEKLDPALVEEGLGEVCSIVAQKVITDNFRSVRLERIMELIPQLIADGNLEELGGIDASIIATLNS